MELQGVLPDTIVYNAMISMYVASNQVGSSYPVMSVIEHTA